MVIAGAGSGDLVAQHPSDESRLATHVAADASHDASHDAELLLARRVTMHVRGFSLRRALDSLSRVSNVFFEYTVPLLAEYPAPVNLDVDDMPLGITLERLLGGTRLRVIPGTKESLTIAPVNDSARDSVATGVISGRVVDTTSGRGLAGATVKIAGTKLSAISSDSGRFVLKNVPMGEYVLTAKVFGYRAMDRSVTLEDGTHAVVLFRMVSVPNVLSGVVTTATGVQERRTVGSDITVINADSVMRVAPVTSVTDLLATRVPGLTVARTSGIPGAPSRIRLRGIGGGLVPGAESMSNDPIVIVDGIRVYARQSTSRDQNLAPNSDLQQASAYPTPSALDQIDPNSIATIEVLKGPSATSQWGSDAGNGVIVITTKRGRAGTTQVSAALMGGVTYMPGLYAAPGYFPFGKLQYFGLGFSAPCDIFASAIPGQESSYRCITLDSIARFQALNSDRLSPFATGTHTEGSATVSGGTATMTYSLTASASNDLGYLKLPSLYQELYEAQYGTTTPSWMRRPNSYKIWATNAMLNLVPAAGFEATVGASVTTSDQRQSSADNNLSTLGSNYLDTASLVVVPDVSNSLAARAVAPYTQRVTSHNVTTAASVDVRWNRWTWLPVRANGGVQVVEREDRRLDPFGILGAVSFTDTVGQYARGDGHVVTRSGNVGTTIPVGGVMQAAVGGNVAITKTEDFFAFQDTLQAGVTEPTQFRLASQRSASFTTAGWYLEPRLSANSRFFVSPGFRFDGGSGSSHASGNGAGGLLSFFPKLNFSWIAVDREGQAPLAGVLSLLRPRVAFGVAGVQPDPQMRLRLLSDGLAPAANGVPIPAGGVQVSTLGNPDLHPERSREVEGGFDASLWHDRVSVTATFYSKMRTDAIQEVSTAPSIYGGQPFFINVGRVRNTGTELQINARIIDANALTWDVNGSLSSYRNKLVTLYGKATEFTQNGQILLVQGYPLDGYWARPILGYQDLNHNGKISLDEVSIADSGMFIGSAQPRAEIPFSTTVSLWHGRVSVNAAFDYKRGITQMNAGGGQLLTNLYADTAALLGTQAVAIAAYAGIANGCDVRTGGTCYGLFETVNLLRFNTVSITVPVSDRFSARVLHIPHVSLSLQGSNMGLWTNYRGKDPDVNANIVGESLTDAGQLPLPRTWTLRIDLRN